MVVELARRTQLTSACAHQIGSRPRTAWLRPRLNSMAKAAEHAAAAVACPEGKELDEKPLSGSMAGRARSTMNLIVFATANCPNTTIARKREHVEGAGSGMFHGADEDAADDGRAGSPSMLTGLSNAVDRAPAWGPA